MRDLPTEDADPDAVSATGIERFLARIAAAGLFVMAAIVTINVVSRWLGRALIPDDVYLVQELMVLVILLPLGVVTATRQHIKVDLFTEWLPSRGKVALAVLEHLVGLFFVGLLAWAAWLGVRKAWLTQDYYAGVLDIPMWVGHSTFLLGIALFLIRLVVMLWRDLRTLI
ncbi:TRAP-type C4-dicarboxylate transport system, small permease component [Lutimaribacter pacificus]|uniref:TRAP transporter small permease protein n=1 Tax=Lutimaribacter pacificus TaxID=391948 RepID=A0A1H0L8C9_9RHOB|nr:TRAP transporter small permease [Lutimaribacter pacificus]SDO64253.1 TRAP-type C4-dicarboxylate transport system, small permease component [Lutimaribacter pacificus]SHK70160.1 TRAP-type C4-dicarboxylate transport system, small permease component [Lutimaribacter pacificus]